MVLTVKFWQKRRSKKKTDSIQKESPKQAREQTYEHLAHFINTRVGVEAFVEPETNVTQPTMVLIATSGEWTRRKIPTLTAGWEMARELGIPVYDVNQVGYPDRMRRWNSAKRAQWKQQEGEGNR